MAKKKKILITTGSLARSYPKLLKLSRGKTRQQLSKILKQGDKDCVRSLCECVSLGVNALKPERFTKSQLKSLSKKKELLRFIGQVGQCRKPSEMRNVSSDLNNALMQSGRGIGLLLGIVVPALINLIASKLK